MLSLRPGLSRCSSFRRVFIPDARHISDAPCGFQVDTAFSRVQELVKNGTCSAYTAMSHAPTVTMPRLKSMVTGAVPGFIDVCIEMCVDTYRHLCRHV